MKQFQHKKNMNRNKKKQARILRNQLPLPVHAKFEQRDGYKTLFFELDDEVMEQFK